MNQTFTKAAKISVANIHATANTTTKNSDVIDMKGYDAVTFMRHFNTVPTATNENKIVVYGSTASGGTFAAMNGAQAESTWASTNCIVEVHRPRKRFLRVTTSRGTSTKIGTLYAIQTLSRDKAVSNSATGSQGTTVARTLSPT